MIALALARRYRRGEVRCAGTAAGDRYVRVLDTAANFRMNSTVATVMDACSDGAVSDAVARLHARHPVPPDRLVRDTLQAVRWLTANRVVLPAHAPSLGRFAN